MLHGCVEHQILLGFVDVDLGFFIEGDFKEISFVILLGPSVLLVLVLESEQLHHQTFNFAQVFAFSDVVHQFFPQEVRVASHYRCKVLHSLVGHLVLLLLLQDLASSAQADVLVNSGPLLDDLAPEFFVEAHQPEG